LYELLTGRPPFRGPLMDILDQVRFESPRRPTSLRPEVPPNLELICLKCLAKKPEQRYATAETLAEELQRFQTGNTVQTRPPPAPQEESEPGDVSDSNRLLPFSPTNEWEPSSDLDEAEREAASKASWSRASGAEPSSFSVPPNYELLEEVGRGGLAVVYKCRQRNLSRTVALKMPHRTDARDQSISERFRIEAAALSRLQHPNVVQVFDCGVYDGQPYVVLEFLDGGTLAEKLGGQPQPHRQSAQMVQTLARAMHYVHEHNF